MHACVSVCLSGLCNGTVIPIVAFEKWHCSDQIYRKCVCMWDISMVTNIIGSNNTCVTPFVPTMLLSER